MEFLRLIRKIRNAGFGEILFRLGRMARLTRDSFFGPGVKPSFQGVIRIGDGTNNNPTQKYKEHWDNKTTFYFSPAERIDIQNNLITNYSKKVDFLLSKADTICNLDIEIFKKNYSYSIAIDWHSDPGCGEKWPLLHWSKIKVVDKGADVDPKFVWELNRHQFLVQTAMSYYVSQEEKYAEFTLRQIIDWIEKNPVDMGINWVESLEVGSRLVSWIWIMELLRGAQSLTDDRLAAIVLSMHQHAKHIYHYPSHYISPNTHLTGEAFALFLYAAVYPEDINAQKWEIEARLILDKEIVNQVGEDGVHRELSTAYHTYTLEYYFQYAILCRRLAKEVSPFLLDSLEKMCEFVMFVERPDGSVPMLGDSDGGASLFLDPDQSYSWKPALCNGAILFNRSDFKQRSPVLCWQSVWLWGNGVSPIFDQVPMREPQAGGRYFTDSNYIVYRSDWTAEANYLLFDAGQMGFLSAGHSHADYLSFELCFSGKSFISDVGTLSYHNPDWREYCRGTRAHNTVLIDNQDQVSPLGSFSWDVIPERGNGRLEICKEFVIIQSVHRAYQDISHSRIFIVVEGRFVLCFDQFSAIGLHQYEFNYHFNQGITVSFEKDEIFAAGNDGKDMVMIPLMFQSSGCSIKSGCLKSGRGFCFPTYGKKVPVNTVSVSENNTGSFTRGMLFMPTKEANLDYSVEKTDSHDGYSYSFVLGDEVFHIKTNLDSYVVDNEKQIMVDCDFLIERISDTQESSLMAVGVSRIRFARGQSAVFENKLCYVFLKNEGGSSKMHFAESDSIETLMPVNSNIFQLAELIG